MAPSNMFSYLRPGHGKRNPSTANLASPDTLSSPSTASTASIAVASAPAPSPQPSEYFTSPPPADHASSSHAPDSPVSPYPPQLPPIARVASPSANSSSSSAITSPRPLNSAGANGLLSPALPQRDQPSPGHDSARPSSRSTTASSFMGIRSPTHTLAHVAEQAARSETPPSTSSTFLSPTSIASNYSSNSKSQSSLMSGFGDKFSSSSRSSTPTAPSGKSGKSRLSLRNPMTLLMRRRSGQTLDHLAEESLVSHRVPSIVPPMPDNDDPSIRGRIVHDFSAPRVNRNFSHSNAYGGNQSSENAGDGLEAERKPPPKVEREHTPVFREHFDDDTSYEQSQAAIRAENLANKEFLARNSWQPPPPGRSPPLPPPPALPKESPPAPPLQPSSPALPVASEEKPLEFASSILSPVQEIPDSADQSINDTPRKRKSTKTPPPPRSRAASVNDPSFVPAGLPTHLTSRSSRFSFQIAGTDNSQEQVLEERHKKKAAEKASKQALVSINALDDEYDDYDMDDYDMDGGYEEEIPMLGDDDGYADGFGNNTMSPGIAGFDFSSLAISTNMNLMSPLSMDGQAQTPLDASGNPIGYAFSGGALPKVQLPGPGRPVNGSEMPMNDLRGPGLADAPGSLVQQSQFTPAETPGDTGVAALEEPIPKTGDLVDDMYFDDGMIEEQGDIEAAGFDENIFDDPSGPLFDRKIKSPTKEELIHAALASHPADTEQTNLSSADPGGESDDNLARYLNKSEPSLAHKPSMTIQRALPDLTNINAYHGALAEAASRAEAEGRFARKPSIDIGQPISEKDDSSSVSNSRPSLVPDDGRFSQETTGFPPEDNYDDGYGMDTSFVDDYDFSDYDSVLEDDPMIAAANAEALAYDQEGFYGQEFGFYANSNGQGESTNAYGGYFGPSGVGRSVSGRNAVREPNLTPITERSEYSTRNSFISINHFRDGGQPIISPGLAPPITSPGLGQPMASPGLAQLARMSPYGWREEDSNLSLDSLLKLRKGAFGSAVSLGGSSAGNSPRTSSPMGMHFMPRTPSAMTNHHLSQGDNSDQLESDDSPLADDSSPLADDEDDQDALAAVNTTPSEDELSSSGDDLNKRRLESPTLTVSERQSLSSPHAPREKPLLGIAPFQDSPLSPLRHSTIPSPSPSLTLHIGSTDTNLSSPTTLPASATGSAPRRQSIGFVSPISTTSPLTPNATTPAWKGGHSRKGSAADSVAYVREHDDVGGDRWVLERRRTAESGELELVGRQIVEGGRI